MGSSLFILGGARSGKSRFAVESQASRDRIAFIATAFAGDADMAARIARHRAERPEAWTTIEEPFDVAARLKELSTRADAVVIDCLTLWVSNRLLRGDSDDVILAEADAIAGVAARPPFALTIVSNEVGEGVHPPTERGLRFRDMLGFVNQRVAAACHRVVLMVAGLPVTIKDRAREAPGRSDAPQAP
ncbi:MAG TPA: bifunctional adenosylcobinamide kinase/adenosylcobinamide-phosphate guanylyltransferase [Methylomirabilota bacterium]